MPRAFFIKHFGFLFIITITIVSHYTLLTVPGFFQDDWHHIYYAYARGLNSLWELTASDGRPFSAWFYTLSYLICDTEPLYWQIWTLALRIATGAVMLILLDQLFPKRKLANLIAIGLFLIYPFYTLQALSVAYAVHWISYLMIAVSFLFMLYALRATELKKMVLFSSLSLPLEVLHLITIEYYVGLEFVRILVILSLVDRPFTKQGMKRAVSRYLPYFLVLVGYIVWRSTIANNLISRNEVAIFKDLLAAPVSTFQMVLNHVIPDLAYTLFTPFTKLINPSALYFKQAFEVVSYVLGVAVALFAAFMFLKWIPQATEETENQTYNGNISPMVFGVGITLCGILPGYAGYYFIQTKISPWNERFAIPILLGLSIIVVELIHTLIEDNKKRAFFFAVLFGLIAAYHIRSDQVFKQAWRDETNFYTQLKLQVPEFKPSTSLLSDQEFLGRMGDYPTSFALNSLYADPNSVTTSKMDLWLFTYSGNLNPYVNDLVGGMLIADNKYSSRFEGKLGESLVISFEPELGQCLWIITPENAFTNLVSTELQELSQFTNLDQIIFREHETASMRSILPSRGVSWCEMYQMAAAAEQQGEYAKALEIWADAKAKTLKPANGFELLPFISSYAKSGDAQNAANLTLNAFKLSPKLTPVLCKTWQGFEPASGDAGSFKDAEKTVFNKLKCK